MITLKVFDEDYPISKEALSDSRFFNAALSEKYLEKDTIELNLGMEFLPAWDYIYSYLHKEQKEVPLEHLLEILQLVVYLDLQNLHSELLSIIKAGAVPEDILGQLEHLDDHQLKMAAVMGILKQHASTPRYYCIVNEKSNGELYILTSVFDKRLQSWVRQIIKDAVHIMKQQNHFDQLPPWMQELFYHLETKEVSYDIGEDLLITRVEPVGTDDIKKYYEYIRDSGIPLQLTTHDLYYTPHGFMVLLPKEFSGDYIITSNYHSYKWSNYVLVE